MNEGAIAPLALAGEVVQPLGQDRDVLEGVAGGLLGISSSRSRGGGALRSHFEDLV